MIVGISKTFDSDLKTENDDEDIEPLMQQTIQLEGVKNHSIVDHIETTDYLIIALYSGKIAIIGADLSVINIIALGKTITSINFLNRR